MAGVSRLIDEKTLKIAKEGLRSLGKYSALAIKLKAVIACGDNSISSVAKVFNISRTTLTNWIRTVKDADASDLLIKPGRGRNSLVAEAHYPVIKLWLVSNPNLTTDNVQLKICEEFGIKISRTATYNLIRKLNLSYITPRPSHYKSNKDAQETFKKTSKRK